MVEGQAHKTTEKIRRRELPKAMSHSSLIEEAYGTNRCAGCDEIICASEREYLVNLRDIVLLRFHDVCYNAWVIFRPL